MEGRKGWEGQPQKMRRGRAGSMGTSEEGYKRKRDNSSEEVDKGQDRMVKKHR